MRQIFDRLMPGRFIDKAIDEFFNDVIKVWLLDGL